MWGISINNLTMSIRIATDCKYLTLATVFLCSILMNNILKMTYMAGFNYSLALSGINSAASYMCCALYFKFRSRKRKSDPPKENSRLSRLFPSTSNSFVIHRSPVHMSGFGYRLHPGGTTNNLSFVHRHA